MALPEKQIEKPAFEIIGKDKSFHIKIYASGRVEGIDGSYAIVNGIHGLIARAKEMELRDQLAAAAMTGLCAMGRAADMAMAERAYELADAMLEARKPKEDPGETVSKD